jgi:DNA-binding MurR/RpiR family transcriptional regulator
VFHLPITELAKRMGVSEATMVRMYKKMGFRGFQKEKLSLTLRRLKCEVILKHYFCLQRRENLNLL